MTSIRNLKWDDLKKSVAKERRERRDADNVLFGEIWSYLRDHRDEDVESMHMVDLPDGRHRGFHSRRGQCAFSYRVSEGKVFVRPGDDEKTPEEIFGNFEGAVRRMAEYWLDLRDSAPTGAAVLYS